VVAERGYGGLAVDHILLHAHMSARTFYALFDDKESCLRAAYEHFATQLQAKLLVAWEAGESWPDKVRAAIAAAIAFAVAEPNAAWLLAVEIQVAGPEMCAAQDDALHRLAAKLREGRDHYPEAARLNPRTEQFLIDGAVSIVANRLTDAQVDQLPGLESQLTELLLAPFLGPVEAHKLVIPPPASLAVSP
jgi:AcrR family transcriptional regulator